MSIPIKFPEKQAFLSLSYVTVESSPSLPVPSALKSHSATSDLVTSICALNFAVNAVASSALAGAKLTFAVSPNVIAPARTHDKTFFVCFLIISPPLFIIESSYIIEKRM